MALIEDLPDVHFGKIEEGGIDWRSIPDSNEDDEEFDEDAPASQALIDAIGFDPDEVEEETEDAFSGGSDIGKKPTPPWERRMPDREFKQYINAGSIINAKCIFVTLPEMELGVYRIDWKGGKTENILVY